jgi:DNA-binding ferritin-like protein
MRDEVRGAYDDMAEALRALGDSVVADADAALAALEQGEKTNG